ncbi:hypothetical protein A9K55_000054 [Cordyceps militaris]|uniref:Uncharacterized protein n=1 Tax=Cordyceps militaris TaxID=73501 RepID=A0A2H4SWD8_CORMI|nr:hypothetical protein A9K55_000054 [Cordyceps militaris]
MPILPANFKSCLYNLVLSLSTLLAALQQPSLRHPRLARGIGVVSAMPDLDDPRTPRKGKEPVPMPSKHVHFETNGSASSSGKTYPPPPQATSAPNSPGPSKAQPPSSGKAEQQAAPPVDNQPTSFPQVGAPPGSQFGPGQWYTSADPRMSLNQPQQYQQYQYQVPSNGGYWAQGGVPLFANGAPAGTHFYPAAVPPHFAAFNNICHPVFHTLVYHHCYHHFPLSPPASSYPSSPPKHHFNHRLPRHRRTSALLAGTAAAPATDVNTMANYQNAGPPAFGANFQPPVPDTTFGPIPHVYVPRFDAAVALPPGPPVGPPFLHFVHAPADPCPPSFTVIMPPAFYTDGYHYYASVPGREQGGASADHDEQLTYSCRDFLQPAYSAVPAGQPGFVIGQQPSLMPQPMAAGQPVFVAGQVPPGIIQAPPQVIMGGGGGIPVFAGNSGNPPDVSGLGRTQGEETLRQLQFAHANKLFEPQEFKPADDDPSRFYYVREVDGNWTQRNRFTIDHMGDCRWYVTDEGWFYAVRLPD